MPPAVSGEEQHWVRAEASPRQAPKRRASSRVAQGAGDPRLSCLLLGPQAPRPGQLPPPPTSTAKESRGRGCWHPAGPSPARAEWAAHPGRLLFPSEHSLAVPAAPATASCQTAACRAASSPRPERPPNPAQGRPCQPRGPADTLGAGRARTVAALPCSGPLSSPTGIRGTVGVARAPCRQRSGMCSGRMLKP